MSKIGKTELTKKLENQICNSTSKQGVFGCFEVTIGWYGKERVDYISFDTKGIWRCYEIKISKSDFRSKAHNTFLGHFNYYVMTEELFNDVKDEIPSHIGVYTNGRCVKKPKKQKLGIDEQILKNSMIRSLYRDAEKLIKSGTPSVVDSLNRQLNQSKNEAQKYRNKYWDLMTSIEDKFGARWNKDN